MDIGRKPTSVLDMDITRISIVSTVMFRGTLSQKGGQAARSGKGGGRPSAGYMGPPSCINAGLLT